MANLIAISNGNIGTSSIWRSECGGATATELSFVGTMTTTTSYVYSSAFTCNSGDSILGIVLYCGRIDGYVGQNTVTVALSDDNGVTATREVTVLNTDLAVYYSPTLHWVYFKFGTPLTADGGADYKVGVKSSTTASVSFGRNAVSTNPLRIIVTDNSATPAAADALWIIGDKTANSTGATTVVTMNGTAVTNYGNVNISTGGIFQYGTSASTNYVFQCEGNINVYANGILWVGNTTNPIPRSSTANLQIMCQSSGQYGLYLRMQSKAEMVGESRTSGKDVVRTFPTANINAGDSVVLVENDTGWLNGDEIIIGPTTRATGQTEYQTITSSNSTSITLSGTASYFHELYLPTRKAPIINLTRNVVFTSANTTSRTFVNIEPRTTSNFAWTDFRNVGTQTSGKEALFVNNQCNSFSASYLSFSHCPGRTLCIVSSNAQITSITANNLVFANCCSTAADNMIRLEGYFSAPTTFSKFTSIHSGGNSYGTSIIYSSMRNIIFDDFVLCGGITNSNGINGQAGGFITIQNSRITSVGYSINQSLASAHTTVSNCVFGINNNVDVLVSQGTVDVIDSDFRGTTISAYVSGKGRLNLTNTHISPISGDINANVTHAIRFYSGYLSVINSNTESSTYGIQTASGFSYNFPVVAYISNTIITAPTEVQNTAGYPDGMKIVLENHDQTLGNHKIIVSAGEISSDTTIYSTSSPSERLTPVSATRKLKSSSRLAPAASGSGVTVSVKVRKSQAGDGAAYNGSEPRLISLVNYGFGITTNTVLDTMTYSNSSWETLTGTTGSVTGNTMLEFIVDCDGTAGWINVDDWEVS